jgi:hypothetical protein
VYHEVWWCVPFDPYDLDGSATHLRRAMREQSSRLSHLLRGEVAPLALEAVEE